MSSRDDNEGVSRRAQAVFGPLLDAEVPMQLRHRALRGKPGTVCGSFVGQIVKHAGEVTCPACKAPAAKRARAPETRCACGTTLTRHHAHDVSEAGFTEHETACFDCMPESVRSSIRHYYRHGAP